MYYECQLIKWKNGFTFKKTRSTCYTDYVHDLALLTNRPAQAESQLPNLEQAEGGISLYVNA